MNDKKCINGFSSKVRRVQIRGNASKSLRISSERNGGMRKPSMIEKKTTESYVTMYVIKLESSVSKNYSCLTAVAQLYVILNIKVIDIINEF